MITFIFVVSVRTKKFFHLKRYRYFPPENQKKEEVYINMRKFILKFKKKKKKNISLSSNPMYGYKKSQLIVPPFNQQVLISKLIREKSLVINCCRKRKKEFFLIYDFRKSKQ